MCQVKCHWAIAIQTESRPCHLANSIARGARPSRPHLRQCSQNVLKSSVIPSPLAISWDIVVLIVSKISHKSKNHCKGAKTLLAKGR